MGSREDFLNFLERLDEEIEKAPTQYRTGLKKFFGEVVLHAHFSTKHILSQVDLPALRVAYCKLHPLLSGDFKEIVETVWRNAREEKSEVMVYG